MSNGPLCVALLTVLTATAAASETNPMATRAAADYVPDVAALATPASSELRELVERFVTDRADLERLYSVPGSALRARRLGEFYQAWQTKLATVDFEKLGVEGRIDATLLRTRLAYELQLLDRDQKRTQEMAPLLPFADDIAHLQESQRRLEPIDGQAAAATLNAMNHALEIARASLEAGLKPAMDKKEKDNEAKPATADAKANPVPLVVTKIVAYRAAKQLTALQKTLGDWFKTFDSYDPNFSWWTRDSYKQFSTGLDDYEKFLREKVVGIDPKSKDEPIIGDPVGADGLKAELANEMISYTPQELIAIAEREFVWVDNELKRASREMGFGDDWKAALEKVKQDHVEPGQQPALVRELALEAMSYVQARDLVTVPPISADVWLLKMMSPERQKVAPFFLGGDDILVAFPTDTMSYDEKLQSLRANNRHFARATVFHELVPGHHLQSFYMARFNQHRELFTTPFWVEGWSLWWEFYLWDLKFTSTPEDRMGALFWRAHRCARIIFSLKFHLGEWTPQQCIDFLVERVGHERASATGEVRRSFNGDYSPLYQAGYMLGALQIRDLHRKLVEGGKMTDKQFHDAILRGGPMPIEMVRAHLLQEKLPLDFKPNWRFAD
jgi:Bacterial protein of unknown function (DUF885)